MIPGGAENFREDLLVPIKGVSIVHEAIFMAVLSAHDDGARGPANGVGAEGILKSMPSSASLSISGVGFTDLSQPL